MGYLDAQGSCIQNITSAHKPMMAESRNHISDSYDLVPVALSVTLGYKAEFISWTWGLLLAQGEPLGLAPPGGKEIP